MRLVLIQLVLAGAVLSSPRLDPLVDTGRGLIRGLQASDGDYSMFLGIPYAKVNGSNPFGPSQPHPDFEEVFEAYDDTAICPQIDEFSLKIVGSLDCLHLNVYVPNKATARNRLPVLVWIHGGGFQYGFAGRYLYGPKYLVRNDIILVTINYRLGAYGFMCLDTADVPGNQGLKDQLSALRWVRENIAAFGGDANKVTIFGESAGGASVDFHLMYAQEKLYDKAIMQSGTTLCPWAVNNSDREAPVRIAQRLGLDTDDVDDALAFLATVKPELVIAAAAVSSSSFLPCVEREIDGVERFIDVHPVNKAVTKAKTVPTLVGYNSYEMLGLYAHMPEEIYKDLNVFHDDLANAFNLDNDGVMETLVRQFYIGDDDLNRELRNDLMNFQSDTWFNYPVHRSIQKYLAEAGKVYHYIFSYSGDRNFVKFNLNITDEGAAHADEIGYLFDVSQFPEGITEEDQLTIDRITTLWTNFVKHGDPTPETSDLLPTKWIPATEDVLNYLDIDSDLTLKRRPFNSRTAFWDLFYRMYKESVIGYEPDNE